ncbi:MAG: glycosyltransferase family 4 protein [Acidobacteria bacterium]|nr:glycosyltransferase family 4 protein [Acidobacteriota bacterium]
MKIFIHTMYYLPEFGSAPILMNELATDLAARGHTVEVVTTVPRPPHHGPYRWKLFVKEQGEGFSVRRIRTNFTVHHIGRLLAWSIYTLFTMVNLLRVGRDDILFLRLPPLQLGVTGALARFLKKGKVILNVQDIHPDLSIESGLLRNPTAIRWALRFEKWIYDRSGTILVISEGFKRNLVDKGVAADKVSVIPNWVDTDFLKPLPKDNAVSRKYGLVDRFVVMYSGTISISSIATLQRILESAKKMESDSRVLFVIVGEGFKKEDLRRHAERLQLSNVRFFPFQPYEDLPALLASADVLLVPLDKEKSLLSVPSKLYNFMAAGRPIMGLAHSSSEVKALIEGAGCGVCVPPEDTEAMKNAVKRLMDSEKDRKDMAAHSRRTALEEYGRKAVLSNLDRKIRDLK